ncbi:MAG: agglutinin biogenesis protein MshI [Burkholderiaceae bacterium]|nr:MAG: agglutinin biogenesis protein MshI [Burkholderiaceae bacterium]
MAWLPTRTAAGWMSIGLHDQRVDLAHVRANVFGRPEIAWLASYERDATLEHTLARLSRTCKLKRHRCATLLAEGEYQILQMEAPAVPDEEAREAVRWQAKDLLDYPVQSATFDVLPIPQPATAVQRAKQVFAVAARNELIGARMDQFAQAKIPLEVIDIPETAQRNIAALYEEQNRGLALLVFNEKGGVLTFTWQGELYACRHIDITLTQLQQAGAAGSQEEQTQYIERISLELQRSLDNFDRQFSFITVAKLMVLPVPGFPDFVGFLGANLYVPVAPLDLSTAIDGSAITGWEDPALQAQYFHVVGMALRDDYATSNPAKATTEVEHHT